MMNLLKAILLIIFGIQTCLAQNGIDYETYTDKRDGEVYRIKTLESISTTIFIDNLRYNLNKSKCPDGDENNCHTHGRLYNAKLLGDVCPEGWHIPTHEEWENILLYFGGYVELEKIKTGKGNGLYDSYIDEIEFGNDPEKTIGNMKKQINLNYPGSYDGGYQFFQYIVRLAGSFTNEQKKFFLIQAMNEKYENIHFVKKPKKLNNKVWISCRCVKN